MHNNQSEDFNSDETLNILTRISDAVNYSIAVLSDQRSNYKRFDPEMIMLWSKISDDQDRMKILTFIRSIAERTPAEEKL